MYLLTISCQQKNVYLEPGHINDILSWLKGEGVKILKGEFEISGIYSQLHWHGIAQFKGRWKPLTQFGEKGTTQYTFRIQWRSIRNLEDAIAYVVKDKQDGCAILRNKYHNEYSIVKATQSR